MRESHGVATGQQAQELGMRRICTVSLTAHSLKALAEFDDVAGVNGRLKRSGERIARRLLSIRTAVVLVMVLPVSSVIAVRYKPHEFAVRESLLSIPLRIVDPEASHADALAEPFRTAGVPVETFAPDILKSDLAHERGSAWWLTSATVAALSPDDVRSMISHGANVFIDGQSTVASALLDLAPRSTESHVGKMRGVDVFWDVPVPNVDTKTKGEVLATTSANTPALLLAEKGRLLWSAVDLSTSSSVVPTDRSVRRLPFIAHVIAEKWHVTPRAERRGFDLFVDLDHEANRTPDDMAGDWKRAGVTRVFLPAWKRDAVSGQKFEYRPVVEAAHERGIEVWSWIEWPHVATGWLRKYPGCRERAASGEVADDGWREFVAVEVPACFDLAWEETRPSLTSANFDGVIVSDLHFSSLYFGGRDRPDTYTPMHPTVRADYVKTHGLDPVELFRPDSPGLASVAAAYRMWTDYREDLLVEVYDKLLTKLAEVEGRHVAVTLLDDRTGEVPDLVRENSGLSSKKVLALRKKHAFEVYSRDPVAFRTLIPMRTVQAFAGQALTLGVSSVARARSAETPEWLTARSVGLELAADVRAASQTGSRIALFGSGQFDFNDLDWVRYAMATDVKLNERDGFVWTNSARPFRLHLAKQARNIYVDEKLAGSGDTVDVPAGKHVIAVNA